jgi:hypothetical protein
MTVLSIPTSSVREGWGENASVGRSVDASIGVDDSIGPLSSSHRRIVLDQAPISRATSRRTILHTLSIGVEIWGH